MSDLLHDLSILYLQNQDLSDCSPETIYDKYVEAYETIKNYKRSVKPSSLSVLKPSDE